MFHLSHFIHKYVGLVALIYFLWMGFSGIMLNHPVLLHGFSLPRGWLPGSYHFKQWNRWSLKDAAFSKQQPEKIYVAGKEGVWISRNAGRSFSPMNSGLPESVYLRDTNCLLLVENHNPTTLYAGTRDGLYYCHPDLDNWRPVANPNLHFDKIIDLLQTSEQILAFTETGCFTTPLSVPLPDFQARDLTGPNGFKPRAPLFRFLLKLHDGSLFGTPGQLIADVVGLVLIFLSVSALYLWYIPWRKHHFRGSRQRPRYYNFFYRYHLKIGIYGSLLLAVIALSGMFLQPPLLIAIIQAQTPAIFNPESKEKNTWPGRIHRAAYLPSTKQLLLATENGLFSGPADGSRPFKSISTPVPLHGMGATVLEPLADDTLLVGSFSGLYRWHPETDHVMDISGSVSAPGRRPGVSTMVAAAVVRNGRPQFWCDYRLGRRPFLKAENTINTPFAMPDEITGKSRISLWHFLFELHNGRIFQYLLGRYTWLLVPLGGLALLLTVITGTYDWLHRRILRRQ